MKRLIPIILVALLTCSSPAYAEELDTPPDILDVIASGQAEKEELGDDHVVQDSDIESYSGTDDASEEQTVVLIEDDASSEPARDGDSVVSESPDSSGWQVIEGNTYYIDPESGAFLSDGIFEVDGASYYFRPTGVMGRGWLWGYGGQTYFFDRTDGRMLAGGIFEVDGASYYFRPSGSEWGPEGSMGRGWVRGYGEPAADYFFDRTTGALVVSGRMNIDGKDYLFGDDGAATTGWVEEDGLSYCYGEDGAMLRDGIFEVDGASYYFRPTGVMGRGWLWGYGGQTYFFDRTDGRMLAGGIFEVDGASYYFRPSGSEWGPEGSMGRGWVRGYGEPAADYFFDRTTGALVVSGWLRDFDSWYYIDPESGAFLSDGIFEIDGASYYFRPTGVMGRGWLWGYGDPPQDYFFDRSTGRMVTLVSSGNAELDQIMWSMVDYFGADGAASLRKAYDWIATFAYSTMNTYPGGSWQSWSIPYAIYMYNNHTGNCYRYASLTCWFARALGYEAKTVSGECLTGSGWAAHGWVEINQNGKTVIIDTSQHRSGGERNFFMVDYDHAPLYYRVIS